MISYRLDVSSDVSSQNVLLVEGIGKCWVDFI